jgi:hypothetical protein
MQFPIPNAQAPAPAPVPNVSVPPVPNVMDPAAMQAQMMQLMAMMAQQNQMMLEMQRQGQAQTVRASNTRSSTVDSQARSSKEPKACDPEPFNGKEPSKLRQFITQCDLVFRLNPSRFPDEDVKVAYMTTYLRGSALDSVRPLLAEAYALETSSVDEFVRYLQTNFGDPDEKGTAKRKLKALKQTGSASEYFSKFRELMATIGWKDPEAIVDKAQDGLSPEMKDEVARSGRDFFDLNELIKFIVPLDNRMRRREQERKEETKKEVKVETAKSTTTVTSTTSSSVPPV